MGGNVIQKLPVFLEWQFKEVTPPVSSRYRSTSPCVPAFHAVFTPLPFGQFAAYGIRDLNGK